MNKLIKYISLFLIFGVTYYFIETLFAGSSSTVSLIMGGIGGLLFSIINKYYEHNTPKWKQILLTTFIMIFIEMITGLILKCFGIELWTYKNRFMNIEGVICLRYSLYWFGLSPIALQLEDYIDYVFFGGQKPDEIVDYIKKLITLN